MTQNQLAFQNLVESRRHNLINEEQNQRKLNIEEDRSKWQKAVGIASTVLNGITGIGKVITRGLSGR